MSGGGTQQLRGRMGRRVLTSPTVQVSPEQLKNLDEQVQQQKRRLDELRKQQRDLEAQLHNYSKESQRLQQEIDQCKIDITVSWTWAFVWVLYFLL